jgi:type 1 glutamine amidotransferase
MQLKPIYSVNAQYNDGSPYPGGEFMQALVLCDGYNHHARVARQGLGALPERDFTFDWIENTAKVSADWMAEYPLVILAKPNDISVANRSGWMTESIQMALIDYVQKGNGLLAIHAGTAGWAEIPALRGLLGGVFAHHPPKCRMTIEPQAGHPLTAGCEAFTLRDEHFFMTLDDPQADIFLTTKSEHGTQPGGWRRTQGAGRVSVLTPGHYAETWLHPSFQALLANTLKWCGKFGETVHE